MTVVAVHRVRDGVLTSADSATLTIRDSTGAAVVLNTLVLPASAGVYSFTTTALTAGTYTATWTFVVSGFPDEVISRVFQVETPVSALRGITLADLERGLAARLGPYYRVKSSAASTTSALAVAKLKSSTDSGNYEDLFMLRRGQTMAGALIPNFPEDDRIRLVATFDPTLGLLTPDEGWDLEPATDEQVELHYLDPDSLRDAVVEGLRRCYFWDTVEISTTTYLRDIDLTESAFWITAPSQIRSVTTGRLSMVQDKVPWFGAYQRGSHVFLQNTNPGVGTIRVTALRSHFTYVNEEDSYVGPNHDDDVLSLDREYALRAGHVSAWMLYPALLAPVANQGLAITRKEAGDAFTLSSMKIYNSGPPEILQNRFPQDTFLDTLQIGNVSAEVN